MDFLYISQGQREETGACPEIVQGMLRMRGFQTPDIGSQPPSPTTATIVTPSSLKTASELMNIFFLGGGGGGCVKTAAGVWGVGGNWCSNEKFVTDNSSPKGSCAQS